MAEWANNPPPTRNNQVSRGMIATHVEKLGSMAAQLLREARRLSGDGPEDTVGGWSAKRAATASFGRIGQALFRGPCSIDCYLRGVGPREQTHRNTNPHVQGHGLLGRCHLAWRQGRTRPIPWTVTSSPAANGRISVKSCIEAHVRQSGNVKHKWWNLSEYVATVGKLL